MKIFFMIPGVTKVVARWEDGDFPGKSDQSAELYPSTGNICSCFFLEVVYAVTVSGAGRSIFKAVERLQFLTRAELLYF